MSRPPFPAAIDSTLLAAFRACPRKFYLEFLEHWKPRTPSVHLHAGGAFAKGLEVARRAYWEAGGVELSQAIAEGREALAAAYGDFECPRDSAKSKERMLGAYDFIMERFPLAATEPVTLPSGSRAIEVSAAHPLPELKHPETGDPILYSGRSDQIIHFLKGTFIEDDKTTSQLGASWAKQWDLRSQFTGYAWLFGEAMGLRVDGVLVRGVSILKTKYDAAEAISYRPQWQVERWLEQTVRDVGRMIQCWTEGYWDYALDHACDEYGGCQFRQVCLMKEPMDLLPSYFERRRWDPLLRQEHSLETVEVA